ncbi:MAG TPA: hypothetical protein VIS74_03780 [Chthoniobacterales bacterium]
MSALALGVMTLWAEPASAADKDIATAATIAVGVSESTSAGRSQVVLAGMVAALSALLVLRRHARVCN